MGKPSSSSFSQQPQMHSSKDGGFQLLETATFLNGLPPNIFGLEDWSEADVLTKVLASQEEYLLTLKHKQSKDSSYSEKSSFDNQCQLQLQSNTTISNVEDNSLSASPSPKSHDKDENIEINENQDKY